MALTGLRRRPRRDIVHRPCPLDGVSHLTQMGAFSFSRRLFSSYRGPLFRVLRSSDSAEIDIYPSGRGIGYPDYAALIAHCTGTNGFVTVVYEQSGSGGTAAPDNTSRRPKIFDSVTGPLIENGVLYALFDGTDDRLVWTPGVTPGTSPALSVAIVARSSSASGNALFAIGGDSVSGQVLLGFLNVTVTQSLINYSGGAGNSRTMTIADHTAAQHAYIFHKAANVATTALELRQDFADTVQAAVAGTQNLSLNQNKACVGGGFTSIGGVNVPWPGRIACFFGFQADLTASAPETKHVELALAQHLSV